MTEQEYKRCEKSHYIEFSSIKNEEVFFHKLIMIKGVIKNGCASEKLLIKVNDREKIEKIENGKFKFLISLLSDCENFVELEYCQSKTTLKLFYDNRLENSDLEVIPLYIINSEHGGCFQTTAEDKENSKEIACKRINLSLQLIQLIISEKLLEAGFATRKTFNLKKCKIFNSKFTAEHVRKLKNNEIYDLIAQEIFDNEGVEICSKTKYVGFLSCTYFSGIFDEDRSYDNMNSKTQANPSLGGSYLCLLGTGSLFSWPNNIEDVVSALLNDKIVDVTQVLDDSNHRHSYGGCFSTNLGVICHELCHTFDLGHTFGGIMGAHSDYVGRFFLNKVLTEKMPERQVSKCQNNQEPRNIHQQKLTQIKRPGQQFLKSYHQQKDNDMTFFEKNCSIILYYHKWFNSYKISDTNIEYDLKDKSVQSLNSSLRLVELRESKNSITIKFWSFKEKENIFHLPPDTVLENMTLFAINDCGDVLKECL